jgi:glycine reductase complex component B subunit gamma
VGLAAREIEEAGISTVVLSVMPEVTASVGTPRVVGVSRPPGCPLGDPGDADGQREVLRAALEALERIETPGGRLDLDVQGPPRSQRYHPAEPVPIVALLRRKPWLLARFVSGDIPD